MWWSTVIYWTKSEQSTQFFNMWHHVKDNYDYNNVENKTSKEQVIKDFFTSIKDLVKGDSLAIKAKLVSGTLYTISSTKIITEQVG